MPSAIGEAIPHPAHGLDLRARVAELETAMRSLEWSVRYGDAWCCPVCVAPKKAGHAKICSLGAALSGKAGK